MEEKDSKNEEKIADYKNIPLKEQQKKNRKVMEEILKGEKYRTVGHHETNKNTVRH